MGQPRDRKLTEHFWLSEFTRSRQATVSGINNTPTQDALDNLATVLAPGMQRVRDLLGVPVTVISGYRAPRLNRLVRGARNSQHLDGLAADFIAPEFGPPLKVARFLRAHSHEILYDQLIAEGDWVHVSFVAGTPRSDVFTARWAPGSSRPVYLPGLVA